VGWFQAAARLGPRRKGGLRVVSGFWFELGGQTGHTTEENGQAAKRKRRSGKKRKENFKINSFFVREGLKIK
jgi:hypothetical protein